MRASRGIAVGLATGLVCGAVVTEIWPGSEAEATPLYLAMTLRKQGEVLAQPQLVGEVDKDLHLLLHRPDGTPRLDMLLHPSQAWPRDGRHFGLELQLDLPDHLHVQKRLKLQHGESLTAAMGDDVDVEVMLLKVPSPEFEAYVRDAPLRIHEEPGF